MGLISISNQAPRGEAEKIPKDISSAIAHIKKLSDNNWHTWEPTFINCLQQVHNAKEILYGEIAPGSEGYDEDLDKALVGLIHACCDHSPESRINTYTVRGADEEAQLGSMLYTKLRKALTLNDTVKLGKELDSIWNDAACLGKRLDEDLKKSMLYHCMAQDWFYANSIDALKMAKPDCATHHMVNDERMLLTSMSKDSQISMAGDEKLQVKAIGDASLQVSEATIQLLDVLYVPKLNSNLLSIQGLIENGAQVIFDEFGTTIKQNDGTQVQFKKNRRQGRFDVRGQALALELEETINDVPEDNQNTGNQDNNSKEDKDSYLWHESQGKQTRVQMSQSESKRVEAPLELVHIDLMTDLKGHANYHYALVAVDDFSSLIYVEPLCTKSAALPVLRRWITRTEQATDRKLKMLHSNNGGEWCSLGAEDWQTQEGFKWQKSVPGISVQNGWAERAIRLVQEKMCSMLIGRACPRELWPYAITAAAHMMNLTPSATKTIPHKVFYGTTVHKLAQQLRVFRCLAWVHVQRKDQQGKYRARAKPAIMIGYDDEHKAWKFCNLDQPASIQWSNSATFHEDKGWSDRQQEAVWPMVTTEVEEEGVMPAIVEDLLPAVDSTVGATNTAVLNLDPTLGEAMNVPLVDSKVMLWLKLDADGVPIKHKAQLVARGFTQREGIDYQETFSLVAPCHGPGCSRSRRVTGSYGRSTGIEDLVDTSREHGRSAVSMETMDSYGFTCKGALSPYARRTRHSHEEDQAQRAGAATRRTKLRWLPLRGSRDRKSTQVMRRRSSVEGVDTGHEEEEQCRRSRHHSRGTGVPSRRGP
ncbi:hypothetical protein NDA14_000979 [Ustilago hordei]|nr:hypothetical protein NDA14_000979 [Ustilago hordei]